MITLLTIVGYLAAAMLVYIRMVPPLYRRQLAKNKHEWPRAETRTVEQWAREEAVVMAAWRAVFWPYGLIHTVIADAVSKAAWKPIEDEKARIAQLRRDLADWQERARDPRATAEAKQTAEDVAKALTDILAREGTG